MGSYWSREKNENIQDEPQALYYDHNPPFCNTCLSTKDLKFCGKCGKVRYCSKDCQKKDWKVHKNSCITEKISS